MRRLNFKKSAMGAVVDVQLSTISPAGSSVIAVVAMLVDTGANFTGIDAGRILQHWKLPVRRMRPGQSVGGPTFVPAYEFNLTITDANGIPYFKFSDVLVSAHNPPAFSGIHYKGLLGRDILDSGQFVYDGIHKDCVLAFPGNEEAGTVSVDQAASRYS